MCQQPPAATKDSKNMWYYTLKPSASHDVNNMQAGMSQSNSLRGLHFKIRKHTREPSECTPAMLV